MSTPPSRRLVVALLAVAALASVAIYAIWRAVVTLAASPPPSIASVAFSGVPGDYTVTISGSGFGYAPVTLPYAGDTCNLRIGDAADVGSGEWGFCGDANTLNYEAWTSTGIVVSGFGGVPGDAVVVAVWNPATGKGATWGGDVPPVPTGAPSISSVTFSGSGAATAIDIKGTGFGSAPVGMPFTGDLNDFAFWDGRTNCQGSAQFAAGSTGWGITPPNPATLDYASWSNTEIRISGFSGAYGSGCATLQPGDPVAVTIYSSSDTSEKGPQIAWGGVLTSTGTATPTIATQSSPTGANVALGASATDAATLTAAAGQPTPTGTVTFYLCGPALTSTSPGCSTATGTQVGGAVMLSGGSATSTPAFTNTSASGAYCWAVAYSGDGNYSPVNENTTSNGGSECFATVASGQPPASTTPVAEYVFSPSPIAAFGSLAPGQSVSVSLTAYDGYGRPIPDAPVDLSLESFSPSAINSVSSAYGSASVGAQGLNTSPVGLTTGANGGLTITYTAGSGMPTGRLDEIVAAEPAPPYDGTPYPPGTFFQENTDVYGGQGTLAITTGALPPAELHGRYASPPLEAVGGTGGYTWSLASRGNLNAGLTLDPETGVLQGVPGNWGQDGYFTAQVTDSGGQIAQQFLWLTIGSGARFNAVLPQGEVGAEYNASLQLPTAACSATWLSSQYAEAPCGIGPYTWYLGCPSPPMPASQAVSGNALAPGLTLDDSTGTVSGTPTTAGVYPLTFAVEDSEGSYFCAGLTLDIGPVVQGVSPGAVAAGTNQTGTVTLTGFGLAGASAVTFTQAAPAGSAASPVVLTVDCSASASACTFGPDGTAVTVAVPNLPQSVQTSGMTATVAAVVDGYASSGAASCGLGEPTAICDQFAYRAAHLSEVCGTWSQSTVLDLAAAASADASQTYEALPEAEGSTDSGGSATVSASGTFVASGQLTLTPNLQLCVGMNGAQPSGVQVNGNMNAVGTATLASTAAVDFSSNLPLFKTELDPVLVGPVAIFPEISAKLDMQAVESATASLQETEQADASASVGYAANQTPAWTVNAQLQCNGGAASVVTCLPSPTYSSGGSATFTQTVWLKVTFLVYGIAGPAIKAGPSVSANVQGAFSSPGQSSGGWSVCAGIKDGFDLESAPWLDLGSLPLTEGYLVAPAPLFPGSSSCASDPPLPTATGATVTTVASTVPLMPAATAQTLTLAPLPTGPGAGLAGLALRLSVPDPQTVAQSVYGRVESTGSALRTIVAGGATVSAPQFGAPGSAATFVGPVVQLGGAGLGAVSGGTPVATLTLPYRADAVPAGAVLGIYRLDSSANPPRWTQTGLTQLPGGTGTLTAGLSELGTYTVIAVEPGVPARIYVTAQPSATVVGGASTVTAVVATADGTPVAGVPVSFSSTLGSVSTASAITNGDGQASTSVVSTGAGTATVEASSPGLPLGATGVSFLPVAPTRVQLTGARSGDFHDPSTLGAAVVDTAVYPASPVPDVPVTLTLAKQSCVGTTDAQGEASCSITPVEAAGTYPVTAVFGGNTRYLQSRASGTFTVTPEQTTLTYGGPTAIANGTNVLLSGLLSEDGSTPIPGKTVWLTLGAGSTAQSCDGVTDAHGTVTCAVYGVNQPLGPETFRATFVGDAYYQPASASAGGLVYAWPTTGAFVIGNANAGLGSTVTFWTYNWRAANALTYTVAPASFTGYAPNTAEPPTVGSTWTAATGNGSHPPAAVPAYMGVMVASRITQSGPKVAGKVVAVDVVKVESGYAPDPGHPGRGTVVAMVSS